jgi:Holliday junction DNA helicase RuvA
VIVGLRGRLERWDEATSTAWLDVGGVSYEVLIPAFAGDWIAAQPPEDELRLFTYYHVSERNPSPLLIGFQHRAEREFFRKFIEVPDMGPAKAVRALTRPVSEIARWVETEDVKALQQLPGIGTRLSQTIVANLTGKLTEEALLRDEVAAGQPPAHDLRDDAIEALVSLQYARREAETLVSAALTESPELDTIEELLRSILAQQAPQ